MCLVCARGAMLIFMILRRREKGRRKVLAIIQSCRTFAVQNGTMYIASLAQLQNTTQHRVNKPVWKQMDWQATIFESNKFVASIVGCCQQMRPKWQQRPKERASGRAHLLCVCSLQENKWPFRFALKDYASYRQIKANWYSNPNPFLKVVFFLLLFLQNMGVRTHNWNWNRNSCIHLSLVHSVVPR